MKINQQLPCKLKSLAMVLLALALSNCREGTRGGPEVATGISAGEVNIHQTHVTVMTLQPGVFRAELTANGKTPRAIASRGLMKVIL